MAMPKHRRILFGGLLAAAMAIGTWQTVGTSGAGGLFTYTALPMTSPRYVHTATPLIGGQVLIAGGSDSGAVTDSAELYDPDADSFTLISATMTSPRYLHTATQLSDGRVLFAGGLTTGYVNSATNTVEVYDPDTGTFTAVAAMSVRRYGHTATLLADGRVAIAGGSLPDGATRTNTIEIYDPVTNTFSGWAMPVPRTSHTATLLSDGRLLIAGGHIGGSTTTSRAEVYDFDAGTYTQLAMRSIRYSHTATLLEDGRVLLAGGWAGGFSPTAELFDPATNTFSYTGSMLAGRLAHTASRLPDGQVLVAGGTNGSGRLDDAEVFDPATQVFTATGSLNSGRYYHTATPLDDGRVLVAGGYGSTYLQTAELFTIPPPPVADAGPDQYLVGNTLGEVQVTLTGHATSELPVDATWTIDGVVVGTSLTLDTTVGLGTHVAELSITDSAGRTATDAAVIAVSLPLIPGPEGPPGTVPSGALIFVLQGDPAPADATYIGSFRQVLLATPTSQSERVVIVDMYRKN